MDQNGHFDLEDVTVRYEAATALAGIDLRIGRGEAVALVGPSGAGKTTLLRLLNGSVVPSDGVVRVEGREIRSFSGAEMRAVRASIGYIHQDLRLVPNLRVIQNVLAGRLGRQSMLGSLRTMLLPPRRATHEVFQILTRVGIPEKIYERTDRLSGGQQQRVAIARALYQGPAALIADEPVSSVDPARARDTVALLVEISRERNLTLCMSLHNLDLAREFFPRLVGIRHGRIEFDASPTSLGEERFASLYELQPDEVLQDAH